MHNFKIFLLILLSTLLSSEVKAAPGQLIPCEVIYELTPEIKLFHTHLNKHFEVNGGLDKLNLIFVMYILPSFDNDSAIIGYKTSRKKYYLEYLSSEDSVWYLLNKYAETNAIQMHSISEKAEINLPKITSTRKKSISENTAVRLGEAIDFAITRSNYTAKEFEGAFGQLDGTSIHFLSSDKKCGWPLITSVPGDAKNMLTLSKLLEDFMQDKANELSLFNASENILKN